MPDALNLDLATLSCLDYHWFWGLRYSESPRPMNFSGEVSALLIDAERLKNLKERQLTLYQKPAVVRFFYWLFNIDNYASHGYILAACKEHHAHLYHSQEKNTAMEMEYITNWALWGIALAYSVTRIYRLLKVPMPHSKKPLPPSDSPKTTDEAVVVTEVMQVHLKELELHRNNGELLSFVDVKSACRKRFLKSHPDKGGTDEEFCRVRTAAELLNKMMSAKRNIGTRHSFDKYSSDSSNEFVDDVDAAERAFRAELDAIRVEIAAELAAAIAASNAAFKADLDNAIATAITDFKNELSAHKTIGLFSHSTTKPDEITVTPLEPERPTATDKHMFFAAEGVKNDLAPQLAEEMVLGKGV